MNTLRERAEEMWEWRRPSEPFPLEIYDLLDNIDRMCRLRNGSQGDNCLSTTESIAIVIELYLLNRNY